MQRQFSCGDCEDLLKKSLHNYGKNIIYVSYQQYWDFYLPFHLLFHFASHTWPSNEEAGYSLRPLSLSCMLNLLLKLKLVSLMHRESLFSSIAVLLSSSIAKDISISFIFSDTSDTADECCFLCLLPRVRFRVSHCLVLLLTISSVSVLASLLRRITFSFCFRSYPFLGRHLILERHSHFDDAFAFIFSTFYALH